MRFIIVSFLLIVFGFSSAQAAWEENFATLFQEKGIDEAVISALAEGANPDQIIKIALPLTGMAPEALVKALFCALAQPEAIREAAKANAISEPAIDEGYQLALAGCARQMEENLNSALVPDAQNSDQAPTNPVRKPAYGSPWKFD